MGNIGKKEFDSLRRTYTGEILTKSCERLESSTCNAEAYCFLHDKMCPLSPRTNADYRDALWIETGGHTCTPWTPMGSHTGWIDLASVPLLIWAYSLRFFEPDMVLTECAASCDYDPIKA